MKPYYSLPASGRQFLFLFIVSLSMLVSACSSQTPPVPQEAKPPETIPVTTNINELLVLDTFPKESLIEAIRSSHNFFKKQPGKSHKYGSFSYTSEEVVESLLLFEEILNDYDDSPLFVQKIRENFHILKSPGNKDGRVLFTGYYEPIISVRSKPDQDFNIPAYAKPSDHRYLPLKVFRDELKEHSIVYRIDGEKIRPYFSRQEIMADNKLKGRAKILAWLQSPIDLFFLQIQGSGTVRFETGEEIRLGYGGSNGRPYASIGKLLVKEGKIPKKEVSMQSIRKYLKENPDRVSEILYHNQSYTFFQKQSSEKGPLGSISVPLTGGRSLATDYRLFPKGGLAFIAATVPNCDEQGFCSGQKKIYRFVVNQDTGGAIRGYDRADLFWGRGPQAKASAGKMNYFGDLYFIIAKKNKLPSNMPQS